MDDFAIRVFPSSATSAMRQSSSVLHYSPIADPPIDYTLHKPKQNGPSNVIPWRNNQQPVSQPQPQPQPSVYRPPPEPQYWPKLKVSNPNPRSKPMPAPRRHTTEINSGAYGRIANHDAEIETAMVLEDLDTVLDNEVLSFEQRRNRIEGISLRPYPAEAFDHVEYYQSTNKPHGKTSSLEKARAQSSNRNSTPIVPVLSDPIIEDLRSISHGADVHVINEHRKAMVTRKYKETERRIEEAKRFYSPEYFREAKFTAPDIPPWKRDLLAKKCSKETIHQFEQNAWREFSEWKQANAPSVNLYPPYQYSVQPML